MPGVRSPVSGDEEKVFSIAQQLSVDFGLAFSYIGLYCNWLFIVIYSILTAGQRTSVTVQHRNTVNKSTVTGLPGYNPVMLPDHLKMPMAQECMQLPSFTRPSGDREELQKIEKCQKPVPNLPVQITPSHYKLSPLLLLGSYYSTPCLLLSTLLLICFPRQTTKRGRE